MDHRSAPIGDAAAMLGQGVISHVNDKARTAGVAPGMTCAETMQHLTCAAMPLGETGEIREAREVLGQGARCLVLVDSASLVRPEDAGQIVITGSHGSIFGGNPANALKVNAYLALFNDAGGAATSRLPALQDRGVAAATVAAMSARIGDARSSWENGVISACNDLAAGIGASPGMSARDLVALAQSLS